MARRSTVVVHAVGAGGATGEFLGAGTLLESAFVLVDPPLNEVLADGSQALRVGVFSAEKSIAEIIDVTQIRVVPGASELVLLQLAVESLAPARGVPVALREDPLGIEPFLEPSVEEIVDGLRVVLGEAPPPELPQFPVEDPIRWIFRLFGGG
ncbi:hypothetical protein [Nocardia mangyaensis]|uniref:hypothetical protein n=1 Tax=Nocardia mangyaensis TaxID=2213200 RepID=UPI0026758662|nr:hypothetical protein [Nocardia mangyaensis]MDO3648588.1 hypothetical protein [Nocardia mangyaensis]